MDVAAFRAAYNSAKETRERYHLPNPYADNAHVMYRRFLAELDAAAGPEHELVDNIASGVFDKGVCRCGWTSSGFWDGWDLVQDQWREHVRGEMGLVPQECPCGKEYITADGEGPCHALVEVDNAQG